MAVSLNNLVEKFIIWGDLNERIKY
jgi:hypothetical protein